MRELPCYDNRLLACSMSPSGESLLTQSHSDNGCANLLAAPRPVSKYHVVRSGFGQCTLQERVRSSTAVSFYAYTDSESNAVTFVLRYRWQQIRLSSFELRFLRMAECLIRGRRSGALHHCTQGRPAGNRIYLYTDAECMHTPQQAADKGGKSR